MTDEPSSAAKPLVSICMPCYNAERHLRATLDSIIAQTYSNIEVVVVDDASTDSSRDILASYGDAIKWEAGIKRDQSGTVNRAFALSAGEFITFHDSDDFMDPSKTALQVETALRAPGAVVYGPWRLVWKMPDGADRVETRQTEAVPAQADLLAMHLRGWFIPPNGYLWPRAVVESLGGWDETLHADKDADFAMRAILAGFPFVYCPGSWVDYVQHAGLRASTSKSPQALRSRARVIRKVTRMLAERGDLDRYRDAIAFRYDDLARDHWQYCRPTAAWCAREARRVSGKPTEVGAWYYRLVRRFFGVYCAENLAMAKRRLGGRKAKRA